MYEFIVTGYKIILKYAIGSFTFSDININATKEQMYNLATAFNAFQTEPAEKIICVTTNEVM